MQKSARLRGVILCAVLMMLLITPALAETYEMEISGAETAGETAAEPAPEEPAQDEAADPAENAAPEKDALPQGIPEDVISANQGYELPIILDDGTEMDPAELQPAQTSGHGVVLWIAVCAVVLAAAAAVVIGVKRKRGAGA